MNEPRDRPSLLRIAAGLVLLVAAWWAPGAIRAPGGPLQRVLVDDRAAECRAHDDGPEEFVLATLGRESRGLAVHVRWILLALGVALLLVEGARRTAATRELARAPLATWILAALLVASGGVAQQLGFLRAAWRDGLFTEDDAARRERFFAHTVPAARFLESRVPPDARILVIDFDLKDPQQVKKIGYLIFPRRLFMLPGSTMHMDTATFRRLVREHAGSLDWLEEAGYDVAVDLRTLVAGAEEALADPTAGDQLATRALVPLGPSR